MNKDKLSPTRAENQKVKDNYDLSNDNRIPLLNLNTERKYNEFLDLLRSQSPISMWKLQKITSEFSYTFIKRAVINLEFCHLIKTISRVNKKGRTEKIIYVPTTQPIREGLEPFSTHKKTCLVSQEKLNGDLKNGD